MTPEEKFNQDVWWILQEIQKDELLAPKNGKVEFLIRAQSKTRTAKTDSASYVIPDIETQRKLLYKLTNWKALDVKPVDNILRGSDISNPRVYDLTIKQPRFDELYKKYELANNPKETEQWVKPILRKLESGKLPYKEDGLFYSLWKYANASRLTGEDLITFMDLAPLEREPHFVTFIFLNRLQKLKIELEDITFREEIYKEFCETEHDYITDYITKNPKADFNKAIKKLFKNKATFDDIFQILGKFNGLTKINGLLKFIEFSPSPSAKNIKPLKEYLETYINCFIGDKLFSPRLKNFYRFSRQKEIFLQQIKKKSKDYGLEFVFRQGREIVLVDSGSMVTINEDEAYLFIHTLAAMEKQDYFEIERILITDMDVPPEKQTDDYKVKILANEKLFKECKPKTSRANEHIQKIQIVNSKLEVDGLKDGLKAISQSKKETDKPKFPYKLPAGTKWEEITIKFVDDENVYIQIKQFKHSTSYKELGLVGRGKNPNPSELWAFLKVLAQVNGELAIQDTQARDKYKKQKELLAKALQSYFSLDYDPFYPYRSSTEKQGNSYKIKITLIPLPNNNSKSTVATEEDNDLGVKEYLKEWAPQVNKEWVAKFAFRD